MPPLWLRILAIILTSLPRGIVSFFGDALGMAAWLFLPSRRIIARSNLNFVFGQNRSAWGIDVLTQRHFWHLGNHLLELLMLPAMSNTRIRRKHISFSGVEIFHKLAAEGRGALLVTAHHGAWDLILNVAHEGVAFKALYKPSRSWVDRILLACRSSSTVTMLDNKVPSDLRSMIHCLRGKGVLGVVGDQGGSRGWIRHSFLNGISSFPIGLTDLALRYNAAIVPVWAFRRKDYHTEVIVDKPIPIPLTGTKEDRALKIRTAYVSRLEKRICEHPEQYFWVHDIWRHFKEVPHPDWEAGREHP